MNPEGRTMLPGIAFRSFVQRFVEPTISEGFQDITVVKFEVRVFPKLRIHSCQRQLIRHSVSGNPRAKRDMVEVLGVEIFDLSSPCNISDVYQPQPPSSDEVTAISRRSVSYNDTAIDDDGSHHLSSRC